MKTTNDISKCGIIGSSRKENERRVPIHPEHLDRIPQPIRESLIFESGYGSQFHLSDQWFIERTGGVLSRAQILAELDTVVLAKPLPSDLHERREGGVVWGYAHCVQQTEITQAAIDRKLTLIAFEDMFVWGPNNTIGRHTFYKNNEMAGYCAVLHALALEGIDGHYGNQRKAVIFSFGAVSRGAIYALKARGFRDITICIQRPDHEVREEVLDCHYIRMHTGEPGEARMMVIEHDGSTRPLNELISEADIIVNGIFQTPSQPIDFLVESELEHLRAGTLIIDVSCDEGMGFPFARPTTFENPIFRVHDCSYYAVDHTPSYLWESASRSISAAMVVHLPAVMAGREQWQASDTIRHAINIDQGVVVKPAILDFQHRQPDYPHTALTAPEAQSM